MVWKWRQNQQTERGLCYRMDKIGTKKRVRGPQNTLLPPPHILLFLPTRFFLRSGFTNLGDIYNQSSPPVDDRFLLLAMMSYGPPRKPVYKPYSSYLECRENLANRALFNEYVEEIGAHLSVVEGKSQPNPMMIDLQPEIKWFMRPYLVNFIVQIHSTLKLKPQTLFLCWNIIDRYCAKRIAFKQHYQLIGCTALWIAAKYEDKKSRVPTIGELGQMCSNVYEASMFKEMELHILNTLGWSVSFTSIEDVLQLAVKCANPDGKESLNQPLENYKSNSPVVSAILAVSRFLAELTLYEKDYLNYTPSMLGSSIFVLACSILNLDVGTNYLQKVNDSHLSSSMCEISSSFLNNYNGPATLDEVKQIVQLLLVSLKSPSEVLVEKYQPLGVIQVVNKFVQGCATPGDALLAAIGRLEAPYLAASRSSSLTLDSPSNYSSFSSVSNSSYATSNSSFDLCIKPVLANIENHPPLVQVLPSP